MGFGIDAGISRTTRYSVQTADKVGVVGEILEFTTYGGTEEISTEAYVDSGSFTNTATNGLTGNTTTGQSTEHSLIESNTEYARESKTVRKCLAAAT